jgi:hypothetical protein
VKEVQKMFDFSNSMFDAMHRDIVIIEDILEKLSKIYSVIFLDDKEFNATCNKSNIRCCLFSSQFTADSILLKFNEFITPPATIYFLKSSFEKLGYPQISEIYKFTISFQEQPCDT